MVFFLYNGVGGYVDVFVLVLVLVMVLVVSNWWKAWWGSCPDVKRVGCPGLWLCCAPSCDLCPDVLLLAALVYC